ncbi:MAG: hypothetical protein HN356_03035 [Calditrichaeota bacterium]|jgi:membrane-bound lytic murein transglycosylase B|nr:hypothetical protein [Calditrichota bacterium]MBT7618827.1 hypothetical protein [Calditrichota bacterium]MBT7787280.1 hypothetical protein [Calditrichota bacterium]
MFKKLVPGLVLATLGFYIVVSGIGQKTLSGKENDNFPAPISNQSPDENLVLFTSSELNAPVPIVVDISSKAEIQVEPELGINADYKLLLLDKLTADKWSEVELATLLTLLADQRTQFLPRELTTNITHKETAKLYKHNLTQASLKICEGFWKDNRTLVRKGAGDNKVPLSIIVSIMFVETKLGRVLGDKLVFNVFWSLAVADHPDVMNEFLNKKDINNPDSRKRLKKRSAWGRKELRELVALSMEKKLDPLSLKGSWAGAFGLAQFLPSSYRHYSRDGNGDGVIDLFTIEDATASIDNYLRKNGWRQNGTRQQHKKTIMRYNISSHYADCVMTLSDKLKARINDLQH